MAWLLAFQQPMVAVAGEIAADSAAAAAHRPQVDTAGNGVALVDIVTPNAAGLSHNKYTRFDVDTRGAILNNSVEELSRSSLGGLVRGNAHLGGSGPARVILNEVTSTHRSQLQGALEVHGRSADVIVANPNGIGCDGCGFLNTPRVTLSTGTPELGADGSLAALRVEGGAIRIGVGGADLEASDVFDLVARELRVEGPVRAGGDLNVVAGRNRYAYAAGRVTALESDGEAPDTAIDSSLLGGMYAGRIRLVSTELGAGVQMQGEMAARAEEMTLTAAGKLVLNNARAARQLHARSTADVVEVQGTVYSGKSIAVEGQTSLDVAAGAVVAAAEDVSLAAQTVTLGDDALVASGTDDEGEQTATGVVSVEASTLNAGAGRLAAGRALDVTATTLDLSRSEDTGTNTLQSLGELALKTERVVGRNARVSAQGSLTVRSETALLLEEGLYSAGGALTVEGSGLSSTAALNATDTVTLRALSGSVTTSGAVTGNAGITVTAASDLTNAGRLSSASDITLASRGALTNTAEGALISNGGVSLRGASVIHAGQARAQGGPLTVRAATGDVTNSGELVSSETVTVDAGATLRNTAGARILSAGDVALSATTLTNAGEVAAHGGSLRATVTHGVTHRSTGTLEASDALEMRLGGALSNAGSMVSQGTMTLEGLDGGRMGDLSNASAGVLNGGAGLTVRATNLTNAGAIGSSEGALAVALSGSLANTGLLYSGTSSHFALDGDFTNTQADVLAETDLTIEGFSGERAGALTNTSGTMEAVSGDMTLKAASVTNQRPTLTIGETSTTQTTTGGDVPGTEYASTTTVVTTREFVAEDSAAAHILAGGDLVIETGTLTNAYSQVAANGDITVRADSASNIGRDLLETVVTTTVEYHRQRYCKDRFFGFCINHGTRYWTETDTDTASSTIDSVYGTIEAGGTLDAAVTGYFNNNAVRDGAAQIGLSSGDRALNDPDLASGAPGASDQDPGRIDRPALDASIESLLGRSALFELELSPSMPYLLETRREFIDRTKFLGSEYFLTRAGLATPERTMKRLGDAYVETRLVRDQVFELTGHRYLSGFTDMRAQMRSLYDHALGAQQRLDLSVGVALTPRQVSALTADIVWLERYTVRGQEVLVPRLYLSSVTLDDVDLASARIHGQRTVLQAATMVNSGQVAGVDGLDIRTANALLNTGGALVSESDIEIDAGALFANLSGSVSGDNVWIAAGAIQHDTAKSLDEYDNGFAERIQQVARIEARGDLRLEAERSILSTAGVLRSQGVTELSAGEDIALTALSLERRREDEIKGGYSRSASLTHRLASVQSGGDLSVEAGADLRLRGAELEAGGDARLSAEGDVELASVQDQRFDDLKLDLESGGLFGVKTNIRRQSAETETKRTSVRSGGELVIRSGGGDITLDAVKLKSEGETVVEAAQGKIAMLSETDTSFEQDYHREEDVFWWNEADKGHSGETIEHVEIEAGGGLRIHAGEGVVVEYHKTGSLDASLDQLAQSPGLAWVEELRNDPNVDWRGVEATFNEWDYEAQGLTEAGAALVSLAAVAVAGPALGELAASMATSLGVTSAAMEAALAAGLKTLASQAAVTLVNHQGDLLATLQQLGSSDTLKSLVTAMVTAGLADKVTGLAGLDLDLEGASRLDQVVQDLQRNLVRATVRAGVTTAIQGGELDDALVSALRMAAADTLGQVVAEEIGAAYGEAIEDGRSPGEYIAHKVAHAALGCATGAIGSDDCGSGAAGGVAGAVVSEAYKGMTLGDELQSLMESGEDDPEVLQAKFAEWRQRGVDLSKLSAGLLAAAAGGDMDVAIGTGGNAAENNVLPLILVVAKIGLAAYTAYEIYETGKKAYQLYERIQGDEEIPAEELKQLATELGIELAVGVTISKLNVLKAAESLLRKARMGTKADEVEHRAAQLQRNQHATEHRPSVTNPTSDQLASAKSYGVDPKWVKPDGKLDYPPNDGFLGIPENSILKPGTKIDRYGTDQGSYFSPEGTPFDQRSLPPKSSDGTYKRYIVTKPLPAQSGSTAPWFGQSGGGMQFKTQMTVEDLVRGGYIKEAIE